MKKIMTFLILSIITFSSIAQAKLDDINRIILNTYVSDQIEPISTEAKDLLSNKLSQIASNYGIGGSALNPRFVLLAKISVTTKDIISGPPQMTAINLDITFSIVDAIDQRKFANTTINVKGIGTGNNETKAYIDAIKKVNINNPDLKLLIELGKSKIVQFFNTQCNFIIRDALGLAKKGAFDDALYKLAQIPDVCEKCYVSCMDTMQQIYQQKIDKECLVIIRNAKAAWMSNQNSIGAEKVAEMINTISPFSTCEPEANMLMKQIENKLKEDEKRKWEFKMKKYNDALNMRKEAMRIDEEDRKRNAELNSEHQKQEYALQKDQQKQQYALAKADQEAVVLKGFVNSITKLKLTLWRNNANDYISQHIKPIDYASLNSK